MLPKYLDIDNEYCEINKFLYAWGFTEAQMEKLLEIRKDQGYFKYKKMVCVIPKSFLPRKLKTKNRKPHLLNIENRVPYKNKHKGVKYRIKYYVDGKETTLTDIAASLGAVPPTVSHKLLGLEKVTLNGLNIECKRIVVDKYTMVDTTNGEIKDFKTITQISKLTKMHESSVYNAIAAGTLCNGKYKITKVLKELK